MSNEPNLTGLLAMIGRISNALGISEEEQACANGDLEILDAIRELKAKASVTIPHRIDQLIDRHGSLRAAARVIDMEPGYLSRLHRGEKVRPGKDFLRRMGLRQVISYELLKDQPK